MRQKLKPDFDPEAIQSDLIQTVCANYASTNSIRATARELQLSPMKVRKILITAGAYSSDLSETIKELYRGGKTTEEIAALMRMTPSNVNSYLPYERIIYKMEERSVEADRQARYRNNLKSHQEGATPTEQESIKEMIGVAQDHKLVIVVGKKLRRLLPESVYDKSVDPLSRGGTTWGETDANGQFILHEPEDPESNIWCAESISSGKQIALMSAHCGFVIMCPMPALIKSSGSGEELGLTRDELEKLIVSGIREGLISFCLPEERVRSYTDARVEFVKGRSSNSMTCLENLINRELKTGKFNIRGNWAKRKYGNSGFYRPVHVAALKMLGADMEEWMESFFKAEKVPLG